MFGYTNAVKVDCKSTAIIARAVQIVKRGTMNILIIRNNSNAEAIENAVGQAIQVAESGITEAIAAHIDKMQLPTA